MVYLGYCIMQYNVIYYIQQGEATGQADKQKGNKIMSLASSLFKSRQWNDESNATEAVATPVAELVKRLEAQAAANGRSLSRWQSNKSGRRVAITYALHTGERTAQFRYMADDAVIDYVVLNQIEGTTERCEAYRKLSSLLA